MEKKEEKLKVEEQNTLYTITLSLVMLLTSCTVSDIPVSAVDEGEWSINESFMDTSVRPGDDFYMYCNGGFWRDNPASGYDYYGIKDESYMQGVKRMNTLTLPSVEILKTDLFRIDETQTQAEQTIKRVLDRIDAVKSREDAWKLMGQLMSEGYQTPAGLFTFSKNGILSFTLFFVESDEWNPLQGSMAKAYSQADAPMRRPADVDRRLQNDPEFIAAMQPVKAATRAVAPEEYKMYLKFCEGLGVSADNLYAISDLPAVELNMYYYNILLKIKELQNAPLADLKEMMKQKVANDGYLVSGNALEQLLGKGYGEQEMTTLKNNIFDSYLRYEQVIHYSDAFVTPEMKATALSLCEELKQVFRERIAQNTWMSEGSKQRVLDKLNAMRICAGYPDQWLDWKELTPQPSFLDDIIALRSAKAGLCKQMIGKDTHSVAFNGLLMSYSYIFPCNYYTPNYNMVFVFPPNIMEPYFSPTYNQAVNYATSVLFSHELTHAFDSSCSKYDKNGELWEMFTTEADKKEYERRLRMLVDCYNALEIMPDGELPGVCCDGEYTLAENIADLGGFEISYAAYVKYLNANGYRGEELKKQKRLFYQAYANIWRASYSADFALYYTKGPYQDVHAMERERVNGIVMNTDDWYELFDIKPTDKLYVAPEKRVKIW